MLNPLIELKYHLVPPPPLWHYHASRRDDMSRPRMATIAHTTRTTTWQPCHVYTPYLHFNTMTMWAMWQLCHVTTLHPTTTKYGQPSP